MPEAITDNTEPVVMNIDVSLKRLYQAAIQTLAAAAGAGAVAWHKKYTAVANILHHTPPLYLAGGYSTDAAFCASLLQESRQSVARNVKVVTFATASDIAKFSATKLRYAIAYVEAKNKVPLDAPLNFDALKIQFKRGDKTVTKTLLGISRDELQEAIGQLSARPKSAKQSAVAKAAVAAVKQAAVEGVQATATKTQLVLRVPFDQLASLGKALADFKIPSS